MKDAELIQARHLLRTHEDIVHRALSRSYEHKNAAWFREQANAARELAKQADRVAILMDRT